MNRGWYRENYRHSLAARGIKTRLFSRFQGVEDSWNKLKEQAEADKALEGIESEASGISTEAPVEEDFYTQVKKREEAGRAAQLQKLAEVEAAKRQVVDALNKMITDLNAFNFINKEYANKLHDLKLLAVSLGAKDSDILDLKPGLSDKFGKLMQEPITLEDEQKIEEQSLK
jgi:hypothetical protein